MRVEADPQVSRTLSAYWWTNTPEAVAATRRSKASYAVPDVVSSGTDTLHGFFGARWPADTPAFRSAVYPLLSELEPDRP